MTPFTWRFWAWLCVVNAMFDALLVLTGTKGEPFAYFVLAVVCFTEAKRAKP